MIARWLYVGLMFLGLLAAEGCSRAPSIVGSKEDAVKKELKDLQTNRKKEWSPD